MSEPLCQDCLDTGVLYPHGQTKASRPCSYCPSVTYHKARVVVSDAPLRPGIWVFWCENGSKSWDIPHKDIRKGAKVINETHKTQTGVVNGHRTTQNNS